MKTEGICPSCGRPLAAGAPQGLCPECLMKAGFGTGVAPEPGEATSQPPFTPPPPAEMAKLFPQLEIVELLGRGGMGAVYKARQPAIDRWVALKVLPPQSTARPGFTERFNREARALARLNHPNIVALHEFGQVGGMPYFLMEYVEGVTLRCLVQARRLEPREALKIVPQICEALQFAHDEGVVHRDIKPENILLDKKGRVKIADFGIAKIMGGTPSTPSLTPSEGERVSGRTGEGKLTQDQVLGTPNYMAPEQVEHPQTVDHRADIYSLGVVFYEMLTGELPLGRFAAPSKKVQVDVRLDEIVLHALEREPELRYQQASQVKTAVETIAHTSASAPPPTSADQSKLEAARQEVKAPASWLVATGILNWIAIPFIVMVIAPVVSRSDVGVRPMLFALLAALLLSSAMIVAGLRMKRLEAYSLAITGSVLAILITPGNLIGLPIGIWAIVVLSRREVREAFANTKSLSLEAAQAKRGGFGWKAALAVMIVLIIAVGALLVARFLSATRGVAPPGSVGWWQGENSTADAAGGSNGRVTGDGTFGYGPGVVGQAFVFDGIHRDRVDVGNPASLRLQNFTIEAWIKRSDPTEISLDDYMEDGSQCGEGGIVFGYGRGGYGLGLLNDGRLLLSRIDMDGIYSTNAVSDTNWHHVAVTKSGSTAIFYIDGLSASAPISYTTAYTFDTSAAIGSRGDARGGTFFGMVDEPSVYSRALAGSEIRAIHKAGEKGKPKPRHAPFAVTVQRDDAVTATGMRAAEEAAAFAVQQYRDRPETASNPAEAVVDLGGGVKMEFVLIRPGSFRMGSDFADEAPAHKVTFTKPFYLGKFEVTQEQWESVMESKPSHIKVSKLPVANVSWDDARSFLHKLREKTGRRFALPTEAQWEYACRAGTTTTYSFGDGEADLEEYAWFADNSDETAHPVGEKKPNPWGLYDMHGNVWERCADGFGPYRAGPATNPKASSSDSFHVIRGGGWNTQANGLRCNNRNSDTRGAARVGLRCVMLVEATTVAAKGTPGPGRATTRPTGTPGFSPMIERVLYSVAPQRPIKAEDLDGGRELEVPSELAKAREGQIFQWLAAQGADLLAFEHERSLALAVSPTLASVSSAMWDQPAAGDLLAALKSIPVGLERVESDAKEGFIAYRLGTNVVFPLTFAFQTSAGGLGVLQVRGLTESPRGVKIRYKLVHTGTPNQSSMGGSPGSKTSPELADDPEMRADIEKDIPLAEALQRANQQFPDAQPLTEEEVIAAVRNIKQVHPDIPEDSYKTYQRIINERVLPRGMYFSQIRGWQTERGHFDVDWKDLTLITLPAGSKGPCFNYRIRARFISSGPVSEAEAKAMRERYIKAAEQDGATNRSQAIRSETNRTSPAAASRR